MNNVVLSGRLARDPEVRYTASQMAVARFTVAVDRQFSRDRDQNDKSADFISCVAFGKQGEFMEKYFSKGKPIFLQGRIQTGSYTKQDGTTVYTTDVVAERIEFVPGDRAGSTGGGNGAGGRQSGGSGDFPEGFTPIEGDIDMDVPF